jgi:hypothetical protein
MLLLSFLFTSILFLSFVSDFLFSLFLIKDLAPQEHELLLFSPARDTNYKLIRRERSTRHSAKRTPIHNLSATIPGSDCTTLMLPAEIAEFAEIFHVWEHRFGNTAI